MDGAENRVGARITADNSEDESPADRFRDQMSAPPAKNEGDSDEEKHLWEGGYSPKAMFTWWLGSAVLTVLLVIGMFLLSLTGPFVFVFLGLVAVTWLWPALTLLYRRMALRYRLTTQRFIHEQGVLTRNIERIEVIDMDAVSYRQTLIDRFLGVGTIRIESGDRSHPELVLRGIDDVARVCDMIDRARRDERVRRGIHIATAGQSGM